MVTYTPGYTNTIIPAIFERDTTGGQCVVYCEYSNEITIYTPPFSFTTVGYSREHVLCKSWMQTYTQYGANVINYPEGADYYNLLLTKQNNVNQVRSNDPLGIPVSSIQNYKEFVYGFDSNNQKVYQPRADRRGDAARAMFYEMVCYNGLSGNWGLDNLLSFAERQDQNVLKLWNQQDPPDKFERTKNEYIHSLQNNRNPFIDHPHWATCINFDSLVKTNLCGAISGVEDDILGKITNLYPNPASDILNVYIDGNNRDIMLSIVDIAGRVILQKMTNQPQTTINMQELEAGQYLLMIADDHRTSVRRFIMAP